jgi:hypothetical protein
LRDFYGAKNVLVDGSSTYESFTKLELKSKDLLNLRALCGHVVYGVHEKFRQPSIYLAVVREPISRFLSIVRYIQASEDHYLHDGLRGKSIDSCLDYLIDVQEWRHISRQCEFLCQLDDFELAKRNVDERYYLVGHTERLGEFLSLISTTILDGGIYQRRLNTTVGEVGGLSPPALRRFRTIAQEDFALHAYVVEEFDRLWRAAPLQLHTRAVEIGQ